MSERLTDERVDFYRVFDSDKGSLAREVHMWRAFATAVIDRLDAVWSVMDETNTPTVMARDDLAEIITELHVALGERRIPADLNDRLDKAAAEMFVSKRDLVQRAIEEFLERIEA